MVNEVSNLPCAPTGNSLSSASEHRLQKKPLPKDAVLVDHRPDVVILGPQKQVELRLQEDAVLDGFRRGVGVLEPQNCGVPELRCPPAKHSQSPLWHKR